MGHYTRASKIVDKIFDAFHLEAGMGVSRWVEVKKENKELKNELEIAIKTIERLTAQEAVGENK